MTDIDYCEGCATYHLYHHSYGPTLCRYADNNNDKCPCSLCIIKMMCKTVCDDFKDFTHNTRNNSYD